MCLLVESIKIKNGQFFNLYYHNKRMNESRKVLWNCDDEIDLFKELKLPSELSDKLVKCRVLYEKSITKIEFIPYSLPTIKRLKLTFSDSINYFYKYADRTDIHALYEARYPYDDILIVKNGLLTDSSFCNIALKKDNIIFTPSSYLLNGTKRQQLLHEGKIIEREIKVADLKQFEMVFLINAMIDLEDEIAININEVYE